MQSPAKTGILSWAEVFALRDQHDSKTSLHVEVVTGSKRVTHVRSGDQLFLHEITTNQFSLKCEGSCSSSSSQDGSDRETTFSQSRGGCFDKGIQILLPSSIKDCFILYPTYPLDHVFLSVQEILNALPAVSKLIYSAERLVASDNSIKAMERLEIIDQTRDPSTREEMLCVQSMKTGVKLTLPATMKKPFIQISNHCFKGGPDGVSALELAKSWRRNRSPFKVKLCPPKSKEVVLDLPPTKKNHKKDRKERKKKCASWGGELESLSIDNFPSVKYPLCPLIPPEWKDRFLLMKPFQSIKARNVMFDADDCILPEDANFTVKLLSPTTQPLSKISTEFCDKRDRIGSESRHYFGPLAGLPADILHGSKSPLLLMITSGEMATALRKQLWISQNCRLAVRQIRQSKKILMVCATGQRFLVSMSYAGTFRRLDLAPHSTERRRWSETLSKPEFQTETLFSLSLPCKVEITGEDKSLGYDQLFRRKMLTVADTVVETTLLVEMCDADGKVMSEQPFEMPLVRTNLSVDTMEAVSHTITGSIPIDRVHLLPSVEFVTKAQVQAVFDHMKQKNEVRSRRISAPSTLLSESSFEAWKKNGKHRRPCENLYSDPAKYAEKKGSKWVVDISKPPPRPPKSPVVLHKLQEQLPSPSRPPKPERYKDISQDNPFNFNNNANRCSHMLRAVDQEKREGQKFCGIQGKAEKASLQDFDSYLKDGGKILSAFGNSSVLHTPGDLFNQARPCKTSKCTSLSRAPQEAHGLASKESLYTFATDVEDTDRACSSSSDDGDERSETIEARSQLHGSPSDCNDHEYACVDRGHVQRWLRGIPSPSEDERKYDTVRPIFHAGN